MGASILKSEHSNPCRTKPTRLNDTLLTLPDGRHVIDDYFESAALERCRQDGIEPGSLVPMRQREAAVDRPFRADDRVSGTPFYTPGAPTTHWGEAGIDPWSGAGYGNKRTRLIGNGLGPDNWMWKMAVTARDAEAYLREDRRARMMPLGEAAGMFAWQAQYGHDTAIGLDEGEDGADNITPCKEPAFSTVDELYEYEPDFRRKYETDDGNADTGSLNLAVLSQVDAGTITVETPKETLKRKREKARHYPVGQAYGVYEVRSPLSFSFTSGLRLIIFGLARQPHTNLPHVPLDTQSTMATTMRIQPLPIVTNPRGTGSRWTWPANGRKSSIITGDRTVGDRAMAILSVEYVFDGPQDSINTDEEEIRRREQLVREAEEWDRTDSTNPLP